ncbi:unnamed protein product, partial [Urochloa humidicola]
GLISFLSLFLLPLSRQHQENELNEKQCSSFADQIHYTKLKSPLPGPHTHPQLAPHHLLVTGHGLHGRGLKFPAASAVALNLLDEMC